MGAASAEPHIAAILGDRKTRNKMKKSKTMRTYTSIMTYTLHGRRRAGGTLPTEIHIDADDGTSGDTLPPDLAALAAVAIQQAQCMD